MACHVAPLEWLPDEDRPDRIYATSMDRWGFVRFEITVYRDGCVGLCCGGKDHDVSTVEEAKKLADEVHAEALARWLRPA